MRSLTLAIIMLKLTSALAAAQEMRKPVYPPTRTDNVVDVLHGVKIVDPYRWLEDGNAKEVEEWVAKQNQLTQALLGKVPAREQIRARLSSLLEIGSLGTPTPRGGRYFYTKREGTQNQPVLYVRESPFGKDRVLLDVNELAKDGTVALDWFFPSKDGSLLAYGLSKNGSEQSTLRIRNVAEGKDLPDTIERTRACSLAWDGNGAFYYTRYPAIGSVAQGKENYNRHVFFHRLGDDPKNDRLCFGKGRDPEDWPSVSLSPDGKYLAVSVHQGWAKSEVYVQNTHDAKLRWFPIAEKTPALFDIIVRNDRFYIHTNFEAPRYRLFEIDPEKIIDRNWNDRSLWKERIPQGADKLENVAAIGDDLVAEYMHDATNQLRLLDRNGTVIENIKLPALGTIAGLGGEWNGHELFYGFQSFNMAPSVYRFDLKTRKQKLWGRVPTDIKPGDYVVEQVKYKSKDGSEIPMFLTYKKGLKKDGGNPTLLYGYGGFNISLTPTFNATRFLFLDKGGVLAIANLRGGGEYGEDWHRAGMLDKKQNTFDDFIAAAEWLIANKVTTKDKLAIQGGSNGGLLMGAVTTQRPDLFKAVVCQVPLLDMIRYHKFLIAKLWIPEYGNADKEEDFQWIHAYSPYQKTKEGTAYPAMLITTAASDSRVDPLHARKMAARLQSASIGTGPILLRQETRAGHGAGKPRSLTLDEQTDIWSFLFSQLGIP